MYGNHHQRRPRGAARGVTPPPQPPHRPQHPQQFLQNPNVYIRNPTFYSQNPVFSIPQNPFTQNSAFSIPQNLPFPLQQHPSTYATSSKPKETLDRIESAIVKAHNTLLATGDTVSAWSVSQSALLYLQVDSWGSLGFQMQQVPSLHRLMVIEGKVEQVDFSKFLFFSFSLSLSLILSLFIFNLYTDFYTY